MSDRRAAVALILEIARLHDPSPQRTLGPILIVAQLCSSAANMASGSTGHAFVESLETTIAFH